MSASHFHPFNNQRDLLKFYDKNTECVAISPERVGLYYTMNKALCHCNLIMVGLLVTFVPLNKCSLVFYIDLPVFSCQTSAAQRDILSLAGVHDTSENSFIMY